MLKFLKSLTQPKEIPLGDFDEHEPEKYTWKETDLGHIYISNINRKILYRITKTNDEFYQVESLNNVPEVIGTFMDLYAAKTGAEKCWVNLNTWIS